MTVGELIEELKKYPKETRIVMSICEGGYDDIAIVRKVSLLLNCYNMFHMGRHDEKNHYEECGKGLLKAMNKDPNKTYDAIDAIILADYDILEYPC